MGKDKLLTSIYQSEHIYNLSIYIPIHLCEYDKMIKVDNEELNLEKAVGKSRTTVYCNGLVRIDMGEMKVFIYIYGVTC